METDGVASSKKRKKEDITASNSTSASSSAEAITAAKRQHTSTNNELPYCLKKLNALQRKIDQANNRKGQLIEIKGTKTNPQVVISCTPAAFEFIKSHLDKFLSDTYVINNLKSRDRCGLVVYATTAANQTNGEPLYTVNYYNTTSRILVNRTKTVSTFLSHYHSVLQQLDSETESEMNRAISHGCVKVLQQYNKSDEGANLDPDCVVLKKSVASCLSDPSKNDVAFEDKNLHSMATSSEGTNLNISQAELLSQLQLRIARLEQQHKHTVIGLKTRLNEAESEIKTLRSENKVLQSQNDEFKDRFKYAEQDIDRLNVEVSQLQRDLVTNKPTNTASHNNTTYASLLHKQPPSHTTNVTSPHRNTNQQSSQRPDPRGEQNTTDFKPDLCAVIYDIDHTTAQGLNQDTIRKTICSSFGSMMMPLVRRHTYKKSPKYIVQFGDKLHLDTVVEKWHSDLFGGSKIRKTYKKPVNQGVIKGVSLLLSDNDIKQDLDAAYQCTDVERICSKDGKRFRAVKVCFHDNRTLEKVLSEGILLRSMGGVILQVELPHRKSPRNPHLKSPTNAVNPTVQPDS